MYLPLTLTSSKFINQFVTHCICGGTDFVIQFLLDTKKTKDVRMFFLEDEGRSIKNHTERLYHNSRFCKTQTVYIKVRWRFHLLNDCCN